MGLIVPPSYESEQVIYYLDANYLIDDGDRGAYELAGQLTKPRLLDKVIYEVLDHKPEQEKDLTKLRGASGEVDSTDSSANFSNIDCLGTFLFLRHCASLPPAEVRHNEWPPFDAANPHAWRTDFLNRIQTIRREVEKRAADVDSPSPFGMSDEFIEHQIQLHKEIPADAVRELLEHSSERSWSAWSKHFSDLSKGLANDTYHWTDEDMYTAAATEAFVRGGVAVIISADKGLETVCKQFTDNLVYEYCHHRFPGYLDLRLVIEYRSEMKRLVEYQRTRERRDSQHGVEIQTDGMQAWERHLWQDVFIGRTGKYWFKKGDIIVFDWKNYATEAESRTDYSFNHKTFPRHLIRFAGSFLNARQWM